MLPAIIRSDVKEAISGCRTSGFVGFVGFVSVLGFVKCVEVIAFGDGDRSFTVLLVFLADDSTTVSRDSSSSLEPSTHCGGCIVREVFEADCILFMSFDSAWSVSGTKSDSSSSLLNIEARGGERGVHAMAVWCVERGATCWSIRT